MLGVAAGILVATGKIRRAESEEAPREHGAAAPALPEALPKAPAIAPELAGLAYINAVPIKPGEEHRRGVVRRDDGVPGDGIFIANPTWERRADGPVRGASLWTTAGEEVHRWIPEDASGDKGWGGARVDDEGYLHVVADGALIKFDWNANVVWRHAARHHHDLNFDIDGGPVVVSERLKTIPGVDGVQELTIKDHGLTFFTRDGAIEQELWLSDVMADDPRFKEVLAETIAWKTRRFGEEVDWTRPSDVFHLNSCEVLARDVEGLGQRGDVLVSPRRFNRIAVIDRARGEIEWIWGEGELDHQHDPTLTDDDRVVVFDNGKFRSYSRVLVVDPSSRAIARDFRGHTPFFSSGRGSVQSLDDGSLFVVIANEARIIQVARDGDDVQWEFISPWIQNDARLPIRAVYLEGAVLERVRGILDGRSPAPMAPGLGG